MAEPKIKTITKAPKAAPGPKRGAVPSIVMLEAGDIVTNVEGSDKRKIGSALVKYVEYEGKCESTRHETGKTCCARRKKAGAAEKLLHDETQINGAHVHIKYAKSGYKGDHEFIIPLCATCNSKSSGEEIVIRRKIPAIPVPIISAM